MAKIRTISASPVYTIHFEVSKDVKVSREGFTLRDDNQVLRGYSFCYDGNWQPIQKKLWKKVKNIPESIEDFQALLEKTLKNFGYIIKEVYMKKIH